MTTSADPTRADTTREDTTRAAVIDRLTTAPTDELAAVLASSGLTPRLGPDGEADARTLAEQLVAALWWRTHTPAGVVAMPASLDRLVDRFARKLDHELPQGDAWQRLDALTSAVLPNGRVERVGDVAPETAAALRKKLWPAWTGVAGGAGAAGGRLAALKLLAWTQGPVWDLLPLVPKLGPVFLGIRTGAATVARVSGPIGIALALVSLNNAFGAADDRALPLLLGAGLIARDLPPQADAVEVPPDDRESGGDAGDESGGDADGDGDVDVDTEADSAVDGDDVPNQDDPSEGAPAP